MKRPGLRLWLASLLGAALVHGLIVWSLPRAILQVAMARVAAEGGVNVAAHSPRIDETSRTIVRPSPDLLYSACPYDVSTGPVRIRAEVPVDTYWSLALFASNTDNFFVLSDRTAGASSVDLVLGEAGRDFPSPPGARRVLVPSHQGFVLQRVLLMEDERFEEIDTARRRFTCEAMPPYAPAPR